MEWACYSDNHEREGTSVVLDPQGRRSVVRSFEHGVLEGEFSRFGPDGHLRERGTYVKGAKSGTWTRFDRSGVQVEQTVWEEGKLAGRTATAATGTAAATPEAPTLHPGKALFAGRPATWWESRLNVLAARPEAAGLLALTEARARLCGLKVSSNASGHHAVPASEDGR